MNDRKSILTNAKFGSRIAEDEVDELHSYFVETEHWRKVIAGEVDIIFGAKGAGKSALYSLLVTQKESLRLGRRTMFLAAENPRGTPAFRDMTIQPPLPEETFRGLWKLYFLAIASNYFRHHLTTNKINDAQANHIIQLLANNGLLAPNVNLITRLKAVYEYLYRYLPTIEGTVTDPNSGLQLSGKITLAEPSSEQRSLGFRSIGELLEILNSCLSRHEITIWLALDRLDVAFTDSAELEANALRALFRAYLDMAALSNIKLKVFLRDDIWNRIVGPGFREASHITRTITLNWDHSSLQNLLVRRIASNQEICAYYKCNPEEMLKSVSLQEQFIRQVLPLQIDTGPSKPTAFGWMLSRTADASKRTAPRELIHLLLEARDEQLKRYQNGNDFPEDNVLLDKAAIRAALPQVSRVRYSQTLCAEYPTLKPYLAALERGKTQQNAQTLAKLWNCDEKASTEVAEKLCEVGFFEKRGPKEQPNYWVPFIYRDALSMVQGAAE